MDKLGEGDFCNDTMISENIHATRSAEKLRCLKRVLGSVQKTRA